MKGEVKKLEKIDGGAEEKGKARTKGKCTVCLV